MFCVGQCRAGVRDEEHLVIHHYRIPRRGFAADMRQSSGNDERVDPTFLQAGVQIRGAWNESAEAALDEDQILLSHVQLRLERVAGIARRECLDHAVAMFGSTEMLKKDRPGADCLRIYRMLQVDHNPTCGAQGSADAVDIGDNCASHRHFSNLAVAHETVLQIDDDVRGLVVSQFEFDYSL
jgi:hypothetical protein